MKKIFLTFLTTTLFATTSLAKSETFYTLMPGAGQHEVMPTLIYSQSNFKLKNNLGDAKSTGFVNLVTYYYGLNESHAFGVETGYQSVKSESTFGTTRSTIETTGMSDILLKYKGNADISATTIYWGLGYKFGLEKSKHEAVSATETKVNAFIGQPALHFSGAMVLPVSNFNFGASVDYNIRQEGKEERKSGTTTTEFTLKGGNSAEFRLFAEASQFSFRPAIALASLRTYSSESQSTNSSTYSSGSELLGLEFTARFGLASNFELLPRLQYYQAQNLSQFAENSDLMFIGTTARFLF